MPDHVINEVVFDGVYEATQDRIIAAACNAKGEIDFEVLLPIPLNCWRGSVGSEHKKFPNNALDWCSENWRHEVGSVWRSCCYPRQIFCDVPVSDRMETALWLALCNVQRSETPLPLFVVYEGESNAYAGSFNPETIRRCFSDSWVEKVAPELNDHLGVMLWGEESWANISAQQADGTQ